MIKMKLGYLNCHIMNGTLIQDILSVIMKFVPKMIKNNIGTFEHSQQR